tara:strand:- start:1333 stop:1650 length:318 start_codon:yes stop_codon:yes gene_type:complete
MYDKSIPFTAYALITITSLVVTYSYITSNQEEDNENNEIDKEEQEEETQINNINSIPGTEPNPDLGENVPNFGGKKIKRKTRNKKYKHTKSKRRTSTNKRKYFFF